jgi:hypothetical protein
LTVNRTLRPGKTIISLLISVVPALACNLMTASPAPSSKTTDTAGSPSVLKTKAPSPTLGPGSIQGVLWHDTCQFSGGEAGEPVVLGQGCVQWGTHAEEFGPNQEFDSFETGWAGVTLHLGSGICPSTGLATAVTDGSGAFRFDALGAGTYCVSYDALTDGNDAILIPGGPTYPERGQAGYSQSVTLAAGENAEIKFGFAWQFYN